MRCFSCEKEIETTDKKRMVAIDTPYLNLWFHFECLRQITDLRSYLSEHYKLLEKYEKTRKNGQK
jgi:hypothetical protein